jgi:hypothetical protein
MKTIQINHKLIVQQYNKTKKVIDSVETKKEWESAKRYLKNLSKLWVRDKPFFGSFSFYYDSEPFERISELENLLNKKRKNLLIKF